MEDKRKIHGKDGNIIERQPKRKTTSKENDLTER